MYILLQSLYLLLKVVNKYLYSSIEEEHKCIPDYTSFGLKAKFELIKLYNDRFENNLYSSLISSRVKGYFIYIIQLL